MGNERPTVFLVNDSFWHFTNICLSLWGSCRQVFVGDVVMLKDPDKPDDYLVRRLAAIEGYEMVSKDEKDEPFVLEKDQCWVMSDNEALKPKVAVWLISVCKHVYRHKKKAIIKKFEFHKGVYCI